MAKSAFNQPDEVASESLSWKHDTQAHVGAVDYSPENEVDEVHQYDHPIGGVVGTSTGPVGIGRKNGKM